MSVFRNLVLVASAGTGKTHTLTSMLLRSLLVDGVAAPRVVATTFSRKAAGELRERLEHAMAALRDGAPSPFAEALLPAFDGDATRLAERARELVPTLARVHVTTMHALFLDMLAQGPALEQRLTLIDEDELRADDDEIAYALVEAKANADETAEMMQALVDAAGGLPGFVTAVIDFLRDVEEADRDVGTLVPADDERAIRERVAGIVQFAGRLDVQANEKLGQAARAIVAAQGDAQLALALDAFREIGAGGKADVLKEFKALKDSWKQPWGDTLLAAARFAPVAAAFVVFLAEVRAERRARMQRTGRIGFGDVLRLSKDLLLHDVAFARAFGAKFDVLLVDEFQDTSPLQRELLALFWEDPRSPRQPGEPATFRTIRRRGLAIVGDRKQAIYGFRGADVSVFGEVAVALAGERGAVALNLPKPATDPLQAARFEALRDNYRSVPAVLQFVNQLSASSLVPQERPPASFEIDYAAATEDLRIPAHRVLADVPSARPAVGWIADAGKDDESQAEAIAREIASWMKDEPEARYRDFAILARVNATVDTCAAVLTAYGIPVVVGGTRFYRTQEVGDVRALLELLALDESALAAAEVLRGPVASVLDQSLLELTPLGRVRNWDPARISDDADRERVMVVKDVVLRLRQLAARTPPEELLALALEELELRPVWAGLSGGELRLANVTKLLAIARRFRSPDALARFLRVAWSDDAKRESQAATFHDDDDAVRILTIHASKGLAFANVFVPRIEWPPPAGPAAFVARTEDDHLSLRLRDRSDALLPGPSWEDVAAHAKRREGAERRRLLYVASTRAARHLTFVGGVRDEVPRGDIAKWLAELDVPRRPTPAQPPAPPPLAAIPWRSAERKGALAAPSQLRVTPTAVQDFVLCSRRFVFAHVLALPEERPAFAVARAAKAAVPAGALSPREEGTRLHRLLETVDAAAFGSDTARARLEAVAAPEELSLVPQLLSVLQGPYARQIGEAGAALQRERKFALPFANGAVLVEGSMDLVVRWDAGRFDVVDYKRSRLHSVERYRTQVALYRHALAAVERGVEVRAGLWSLEDDAPHFFTPDETRAAAAEVDEALPRLLRTVHAPDTTRQPEPYCLRIRCGFRPRCHSGSNSSSSPASDA